jgi:hypothetical protein
MPLFSAPRLIRSLCANLGWGMMGIAVDRFKDKLEGWCRVVVAAEWAWSNLDLRRVAELIDSILAEGTYSSDHRPQD